MTNMSYCRFENTLTDLRDCHEQLQAMTRGDGHYLIGRSNDREREARIKLCQEVLAMAETLREALGLEPDDVGEVSDETIKDWAERCDEAAEEDDRDREEQ